MGACQKYLSASGVRDLLFGADIDKLDGRALRGTELALCN